ncbi:MAG: hypothetical protein ACYDAP_02120 [Thermoplasmataceae archaeon]
MTTKIWSLGEAGRVMKNHRKNGLLDTIEFHCLTTLFILALIGFLLFIVVDETARSLIWRYMESEPTAFATLVLALVTVSAILKVPASRVFSRPNIIVLPEVRKEYPQDKNDKISIFATQPPVDDSPLYIWIRLYIKNEGRSVARDVYAKIVSVAKYTKGEGDELKNLTPFNPFKLRWVSSDKIAEIEVPWYSSAIRGQTAQNTRTGDLVQGEFEYLNLCTFVGAPFKKAVTSNFLVLVPGLPKSDGHGNNVGEGAVAGMNREILEVKYSKVRGEWEKLMLKLEVIIGGSNFRTRTCTFIVECHMDKNAPFSLDDNDFNRCVDVQDKVKISIEQHR